MNTDLTKQLAELLQLYESGQMKAATYHALVAALAPKGNGLASVQGSGSLAQGEGAVAAGASGLAVGATLRAMSIWGRRRKIRLRR